MWMAAIQICGKVTMMLTSCDLAKQPSEARARNSVAFADRGLGTLGIAISREPAMLLPQCAFHAAVNAEARRGKRSGRSCVLILLRADAVAAGAGVPSSVSLISAISNASRTTDVIGWYEAETILGVLFTDVASDGAEHTSLVLREKLVAVLQAQFRRDFSDAIHVAGIALTAPSENPNADNSDEAAAASAA
jgi:hypothetical protein